MNRKQGAMQDNVNHNGLARPSVSPSMQQAALKKRWVTPQIDVARMSSAENGATGLADLGIGSGGVSVGLLSS